MTRKQIVTTLAAVALSLVAATHRWGDTAHSIALITAKEGGVVRHAPHFGGEPGRYTLVASVNVLPPYRGDARVVLEGDPPFAYQIHASRPVVDLDLRRHPTLEGNVIRGLAPRDSVTLWLVAEVPECDPVCGMARQDHFLRRRINGDEFYFCSQGCLTLFADAPDRRAHPAAAGVYDLALYDTATDRKLVSIPVSFADPAAGTGGGHAH